MLLNKLLDGILKAAHWSHLTRHIHIEVLSKAGKVALHGITVVIKLKLRVEADLEELLHRCAAVQVVQVLLHQAELLLTL